MSIRKLVKRSDGTYLGEDEEGNLYVGTVAKVGFDEMTRTVTQNDDNTVSLEYHVRGQLHAKARMAADAFDGTEYKGGKEWKEEARLLRDDNGYMVIDPETNEPKLEVVRVEKKIDIIEWSELS